MRRSFRFRLAPTVKQAQALTGMLADHRAIYNAALQERRDAYRKAGITIGYGSQSAQLKDIRRFDPNQARWSFSSQQATLRRLNLAFAAFFRRVKAGDKPGYPRFKGAGWFDTVAFPKDGDGCRWDSVPDSTGTRVYLQGVGHVRVVRHRPVQGVVKTISVKREGTAWVVILSCDEVPTRPLPSTGRRTGLDVGVTEFVALSDGSLIANPRWAQQASEQLAEAQRQHSLRYPKTAARSNRKTRSAQQAAKLHRTIARRRLDFHHKTALKLVRAFDLICYELLNIENMTRAPKQKPDPAQHGCFLPNGKAAKAGLNKSILDAAWGQFLSILHAKAECAGRLAIGVNPRNSSITCHQCGRVDKASRSGTIFHCTGCGHYAHADVHAARNHLRSGLGLVQGQTLAGSHPR